jgi:hypothetical protein
LESLSEQIQTQLQVSSNHKNRQDQISKEISEGEEKLTALANKFKQEKNSSEAWLLYLAWNSKDFTEYFPSLLKRLENIESDQVMERVTLNINLDRVQTFSRHLVEFQKTSKALIEANVELAQEKNFDVTSYRQLQISLDRAVAKLSKTLELNLKIISGEIESLNQVSWRVRPLIDQVLRLLSDYRVNRETLTEDFQTDIELLGAAKNDITSNPQLRVKGYYPGQVVKWGKLKYLIHGFSTSGSAMLERLPGSGFAHSWEVFLDRSIRYVNFADLNQLRPSSFEGQFSLPTYKHTNYMAKETAGGSVHYTKMSFSNFGSRARAKELAEVRSENVASEYMPKDFFRFSGRENLRLEGLSLRNRNNSSESKAVLNFEIKAGFSNGDYLVQVEYSFQNSVVRGGANLTRMTDKQVEKLILAQQDVRLGFESAEEIFKHLWPHLELM